MKFLSVIKAGHFQFDYDAYYDSIIEIKDKLGVHFIDEYLKHNYFHDYYVKSIEISAFEKGKSCFLLTLSNGYKDSSERCTLNYTNVESIKYINEVGYQDTYLYGEISYNNNLLKHEILLGDGKLEILFDAISII